MSRFLNTRHGDHYLVINLSGREYNYALFGNRVINAGFPDHHSPPLSVMWSIYSIIDFWLARDDQNVVAIHCLAGKGRTGLTIICTLLMQGFFNSVPGKTKDIINAAINYFLDKRGDGVENPDQVRFIYQFVQSMNTMGTDAYKITSQHLQPLIFISDLILYNLPVGVGEPLHPRLQVFLKARNAWDVVYTSEWNQQRSQSISSFHSSFVIPVCSLDVCHVDSSVLLGRSSVHRLRRQSSLVSFLRIHSFVTQRILTSSQFTLFKSSVYFIRSWMYDSVYVLFCRTATLL